MGSGAVPRGPRSSGAPRHWVPRCPQDAEPEAQAATVSGAARARQVPERAVGKQAGQLPLRPGLTGGTAGPRVGRAGCETALHRGAGKATTVSLP